LTTTEVADELRVGLKQTRRRLRSLADEGVVGTRQPGGEQLWWLEKEIKEPITVRYPLLRFVWGRTGVLITVFGTLLALIGAFAIMLFLGLNASEMGFPVGSREDVLRGGLYSIAIGTAIMIGGAGAFLINSIGPRLFGRVKSWLTE
jgi:hypothetical protein